MAIKTTLDASADAAALAAVTEALSSMASSNGLYTNNEAVAIPAGIQAGQSMFVADAAKSGNNIGGTPVPNVTLTVKTFMNIMVAMIIRSPWAWPRQARHRHNCRVSQAIPARSAVTSPTPEWRKARPTR